MPVAYPAPWSASAMVTSSFAIMDLPRYVSRHLVLWLYLPVMSDALVGEQTGLT